MLLIIKESNNKVPVWLVPAAQGVLSAPGMEWVTRSHFVVW
jgi:hypothetical protein